MAVVQQNAATPTSVTDHSMFAKIKPHLGSQGSKTACPQLMYPEQISWPPQLSGCAMKSKSSLVLLRDLAAT
jgi:hypothetical protein